MTGAQRNGSPRVGDRMPDGTICAGVSPDTGKPMYALPADAPLTMKWQRAIAYAARFVGHGHPRGAFRVPTGDELNVLFENRAKIGGFNETGSYPASWYWSATEYQDCPFHSWNQSFDDGYRDCYDKGDELSVRLVRSEP